MNEGITMKLKPDDNWRWYFDSGQQRLMLDLADGMLFRSRYPMSMLTPDAFTESAFCVDDAALFFTYQEKCQRITIPQAEKAELILNALVANRFMKPLMPKSWHFASHSDEGFRPTTGDIVTVHLLDRDEDAILLVVEEGEKASLCLLAQSQLMLNAKTLQLGDPIKIMHDRLLPAAAVNDVDRDSSQYACVG